jgi:DNA-binding transcriptional regulator/RsmH inhibitor MraZ
MALEVASLDDRIDREEIPRGTYVARIGPNGRLKLPAEIYRYLIRVSQEGAKLFVTTTDMQSIRIYTVEAWKRNQELFSSFRDDPQAARTVEFVANVMGRDSELDDQGRVVIHAELRRKLGLEDEEVRLQCHKGRVSIYSEKLIEELLSQATQSLPAAMTKLEQAGLL